MRRGRTLGVLGAVIVALLPSAPAAADIAWPDGLGPAQFHALTVGAASITAGRAHSCAITSTGALYCWGDNNHGQLGHGSAPAGSDTAVAAGGHGDLRTPVVQVDAGDAHTCALDYNGTPYCWGDNGDGQLGTGGTTGVDEPAAVAVAPGSTFVEITTGADHSCAIDDQGGAWCWGANAEGQLGIGSAGAGSPAPVQVSAGSGMTGPVVDIAAGGDTTCAETDAGVAWCWGGNGHGQVGDGTFTDRDEPVRVDTPGVLIRQLAVGGHRTCAVDAGGDVRCWGDGIATPVAVGAGGVRFSQVAAGDDHVCGLSRAAAGYCWGANADGELGDGTTVGRTAPQPVDGVPELRDIDAGDRHSCGLDARGIAYCWGADDEGQLGNGPAGATATAVRVDGLPRPPAAATRLRVTPLDRGLRATWRPVHDFGSGTFLTYLAVTTNFEAGCEVDTATGAGCDLIGLVNGTDYDVTVLTYTTDGTTLSAFSTAAPRAAPPAPPGLRPGGELPVTGNSPVTAVAVGSLLVGLGLSALLVRTTGSRPGRRRGTGRHRP